MYIYIYIYTYCAKLKDTQDVSMFIVSGILLLICNTCPVYYVLSLLIRSRSVMLIDLKLIVHGPQNILNATGAAGSCRRPIGIAPHLLSTSHFAIIKTARSGSNQPNEQTKGRRAKPNRGTFVWCRAFGGSRDGLARSARPTDRPLVCCYLFVVRGRRRTPGDEAVACVLEHALWSACPLTHSSLYFLFRRCECRVIRHGSE